MDKTVSFHTLGCRLNLSETGSIADQFVQRDIRSSLLASQVTSHFSILVLSQMVPIPTCRNLIRKAHKASPEGKVVVAGCYAQMEADKIKAMQGVDLILGTNEKYKVFDYLSEEDQAVVKIDKTNEFWGASTTKADSHTRAFLKFRMDAIMFVHFVLFLLLVEGQERSLLLRQKHRPRSFWMMVLKKSFYWCEYWGV
jgi:threonylcarbamoyladenosine tRNA methylthiotransferase MtaB